MVLFSNSESMGAHPGGITEKNFAFTNLYWDFLVRNEKK